MDLLTLKDDFITYIPTDTLFPSKMLGNGYKYNRITILKRWENNT